MNEQEQREHLALQVSELLGLKQPDCLLLADFILAREKGLREETTRLEKVCQEWGISQEKILKYTIELRDTINTLTQQLATAREVAKHVVIFQWCSCGKIGNTLAEHNSKCALTLATAIRPFTTPPQADSTVRAKFLSTGKNLCEPQTTTPKINLGAPHPPCLEGYEIVTDKTLKVCKGWIFLLCAYEELHMEGKWEPTERVGMTQDPEATYARPITNERKEG